METQEPIQHPLVDEFFSSFENGRYFRVLN